MKTPILAIDPGTTESGFIEWGGKEIGRKGKIANTELLKICRETSSDAVIEEINPYTMGKSTRDTILWSGRFQEAVEFRGGSVWYIPRRDVREHLCDNAGSKITDSVITAALVDRFAYGQKNFGKGNKAAPGFFYGFKKDVWQAFALAVVFIDKCSHIYNQEGER
jgi:hypothetical protein